MRNSPRRSRRFTWSGVSLGRALSSSAAAPDVSAAASDVPLPLRYRESMPPESPSFWSMYEPGTRSPWILLPGATTSSARADVPFALNDASLSSRVFSVPLVSSAPTARTYGSAAGMSIGLPPRLPAAATTTMPERQATSAACASGSTRYGWRGVGAERQVQHADVESVAVRVLHDPVDAGDDL